MTPQNANAWVREIRTSTRTYQHGDFLKTADGKESEIWDITLHENGATITLFPATSFESRQRQVTRIWIPTHEITKAIFTSEMNATEAQEWKEIGGNETTESNEEADKQREQQTKKENTK